MPREFALEFAKILHGSHGCEEQHQEIFDDPERMAQAEKLWDLAQSMRTFIDRHGSC